MVRTFWLNELNVIAQLHGGLGISMSHFLPPHVFLCSQNEHLGHPEREETRW